MVISHKYKYIFIQLDRTASTAIAKELCENYEGKHILWKHARYCDLLTQATAEEKKYFAFSGIRNPLDVIVSDYYLYKNDQFGRFKFGAGKHGVTPHNYKKYLYILNNNASFIDFLKKYYLRGNYWEWKTIDFEKLNYIYRFESLQKNFTEILKSLQIKQKRKLPVINKTIGKNSDFLSYYHPEVRNQVMISFSRYMKRWNYRFPSMWIKNQKKSLCIEKSILNIEFTMRKIIHKLLQNPYIYKKVYAKYF